MNFSEVIQLAKARFLHQGEHPACVFVGLRLRKRTLLARGDEQWSELIEFASFPDGPAKKTLLFSVGREFAQARKHCELETVTFVTEAWASRYSNEEEASRRRIAPRDDPNRIEVVLIEHLKVQNEWTREHRAKIYEICRSGEGVDLLEIAPDPASEEGNWDFHAGMTEFFLAGWKSRHLSVSQLAALARRMGRGKDEPL